jgi:cobalt/nickel transport system permease protein
MHIPDGILPLPVTLAGYAAAIGVTALCIRRIRAQGDPHAQVPRAALLSAAFFVASLIHIPVPPLSVHLTLNGLLGVVLGWFAFPAILVALFLQAVMFGHGGLTTLGVNAIILGLPSLAGAALFRLRPQAGAAMGFLVGSATVTLSVLLFAAILLLNLPAHLDAEMEKRAIGVLALAHLPAIVLEGVLTAMLVVFFRRVSPAFLESA